MSNGINGLFAFIEQGTDPRLEPGFDAPVNAICTFGGAMLVKTGDAPTAWTAAGGGGGFEGGTVPDPTLFESAVEFAGTIFGPGGPGPSSDALVIDGPLVVSNMLIVDAEDAEVRVGGGASLEVDGAISTTGGDITTPNNMLPGQIYVGVGPNYTFRALTNQIGFFGLFATQQTAVPDVAGGTTVDAESRAAINGLLARLRAYGLIAT